MRLHCTYAGGGGGGGGEQGMLMYITGRMQPIRTCRGGVRKKECASPHLAPSQTRPPCWARPNCHHEGAARVALQVHKAVLVYAEKDQRRSEKVCYNWACFRVG